MSFLYQTLQSWWNSFWQSLGLSNKEGSLLLLGLDNAGKTTLLHRLSSGGDVRPFPPTDRPRHDSFVLSTTNNAAKNIRFKAWDLGGHEAVRHLWEDYVPQVSAVLFVIDVTDPQRFEEAGYELDALLVGNTHSENNRTVVEEEEDEEDGEAEGGAAAAPKAAPRGGPLAHLPIAVLLNKCDLMDQAASTHDVLQAIDFTHLQTMHPQDKLQVFRISVLTGEGYPDAFRWVASFL